MGFGFWDVVLTACYVENTYRIWRRLVNELVGGSQFMEAGWAMLYLIVLLQDKDSDIKTNKRQFHCRTQTPSVHAVGTNMTMHLLKFLWAGFDLEL